MEQKSKTKRGKKMGQLNYFRFVLVILFVVMTGSAFAQDYVITGHTKYLDNNQAINVGYVISYKINESSGGAYVTGSARINSDGSYTIHAIHGGNTHVAIFPNSDPDVAIFPNSDPDVAIFPNSDPSMDYAPGFGNMQDVAIFPNSEGSTFAEVKGMRIQTGNRPMFGTPVTGSVKCEGLAVNGALVYFMKDNLVYAYASTNSEGKYSVSYLEPGRYEVVISRNGYNTLSTNLTVDNNSAEVRADYSVVNSRASRLNNTVKEFRLNQNYPNPFNPSTKIDFTLNAKGFTTLKVYDIAGKEVSNLVSQNLESGSYSYTLNASVLTSGAYFYKLSVNGNVQTKTMLLVK
jgi:hypothetical protein